MDRSLTARLVSAGLLPLAALSAHATDATLTADTHVNSARPTTNYGYLSNISVGSGTTSLFQFDLSTLPTGTIASQISKATLHLFINRVYTPGTVDVLPVTSPWTDLWHRHLHRDSSPRNTGPLRDLRSGDEPGARLDAEHLQHDQ